MRAEQLNAEFGIAGILDFVETEHGLVKARISLDGVTGELYLQGAQVTAWQPPGERPVLFTSPNSAFAPGRAIRGGIPIVFPWFGPSRLTPTRRSTALRAPPRGIWTGWKPRAAGRSP
jgi:glucose-6-phosphate 1-epimerase